MEGVTLANNVDAVLDQIEAQQAIELEPNATSLKLLQTIYRSATIPLPTRMRAAIAAIQFEHPKLAVTATLSGGDFADHLDQAVERSRRVSMIEAKPIANEASVPSDTANENKRPTPSNGHRPPVADRRYRRW